MSIHNIGEREAHQAMLLLSPGWYNDEQLGIQMVK